MPSPDEEIPSLLAHLVLSYVLDPPILVQHRVDGPSLEHPRSNHHRCLFRCQFSDGLPSGPSVSPEEGLLTVANCNPGGRVEKGGDVPASFDQKLRPRLRGVSSLQPRPAHPQRPVHLSQVFDAQATQLNRVADITQHDRAATTAGVLPAHPTEAPCFLSMASRSHLGISIASMVSMGAAEITAQII